ncbi:MAG: 3-deoxy-manno-octulosonate cytidylyltransferase [Candidatus Firestonebacteria bacterium RIFOXYC2_FULL_39_67]|nr:MAG: 3-deoxy-manno-octulosonate cytidylyltransferase [Candidatus Firestonebacteria bacterium RIFOXYD2_FULL_39_29]OGF55021.1 MAG: 3-deoxy-manno-octulosonate cytidylyltransferase [Candidatus Firestonebacteria bacterium RIFOXYC2_FULL_39_67]OGF57670.1 MAG: 3-deoxy-manno-octulosonate cytidylyltransferase [Candidatus Firestonebacteria bacterium RifOxyC12_full_39_7]
MKIIGVIPARLGSTRFPEKVIADIMGKPMIWWVWKQAKKAKLISEFFIATDDKRIYDIVKSFGGNPLMTSKKHKSGTDRIAEAVKNIKADIVVNIQGDEPLIRPDMLDKAVEPLIMDKKLVMSTLVCKVSDKKLMLDPNIVKVTVDKDGYALYFSRSAIPSQARAESFEYFLKHIGVYVYRKDFLLKYVQMKQSSLEKTEKLEQLRVLENGYKIKTIQTKFDTVPVDTEADLKKVVEILRKNGK